MKLKGIEYKNISYKIEKANYAFSNMVEYEYITNILLELADLLQHVFYEYDFTIYSRSAYSKKLMNNVNKELPVVLNKSEKKQVVLYLSDELSSVPKELATRTWAIFKHFLPSGFEHRNIFPLPLGYNKSTHHIEVKPINERGTNVFFFGQLSAGRVELFRHLLHLDFIPTYLLNMNKRLLKLIKTDFSSNYPRSFIKFTTGFGNGYGSQHYVNTLYNSKIALCPAGLVSGETLRHFEAMRAGCIIITKPLPDTYFYKDSPMIVIDEWAKADTVIRELLIDPQRMQQIQIDTLKWWQEKCSEKAVAQYMAQKLHNLEPNLQTDSYIVM